MPYAVSKSTVQQSMIRMIKKYTPEPLLNYFTYFTKF